MSGGVSWYRAVPGGTTGGARVVSGGTKWYQPLPDSERWRQMVPPDYKSYEL